MPTAAPIEKQAKQKFSMNILSWTEENKLFKMWVYAEGVS